MRPESSNFHGDGEIGPYNEDRWTLERKAELHQSRFRDASLDPSQLEFTCIPDEEAIFQKARRHFAQGHLVVAIDTMSEIPNDHMTLGMRDFVANAKQAQFLIARMLLEKARIYLQAADPVSAFSMLQAVPKHLQECGWIELEKEVSDCISEKVKTTYVSTGSISLARAELDGIATDLFTPDMADAVGDIEWAESQFGEAKQARREVELESAIELISEFRDVNLWPPQMEQFAFEIETELAREKSTIERAFQYIDDGDFEAALQEFSTVHENRLTPDIEDSIDSIVRFRFEDAKLTGRSQAVFAVVRGLPDAFIPLNVECYVEDMVSQILERAAHDYSRNADFDTALKAFDFVPTPFLSDEVRQFFEYIRACETIERDRSPGRNNGD